MLVTAAIALGLSASAKSVSWYFKPSKEGERPICFGGDSMPDRYGALYLGKDEKVIYLTFDAGYENGNVAKTLDVLAERDVKATFFILPGIVRNNTDVVKRMLDEGHIIGNHSYSHKNMGLIDDYNTFSAELKGLDDVCLEYLGTKASKFFRPPEGAFSENMLKFCAKAGYTPVFWSFAYADWDNNNQKDKAWAKQKILSSVHNGEIMLLHPTSATNAAILGEVIAEIKNMGYRFGTLDELTASAGVDYQKLREYKSDGRVFAGSPSAGKYICLTFDDGPCARYTPRILDILKQYDVKATFFVIGKNAEENIDLLHREIAEGHEIGVHTYSHRQMSSLGVNELQKEIEATAELIKSAGFVPRLFRAPGGEVWFDGIDLANSLGYTVVMWSWRTDTKDWSGAGTQSIISTVLNNLSGGDVVLMHDYNYAKSYTPDALEELIPHLLDEGYRFVTVSELCALSAG